MMKSIESTPWAISLSSDNEIDTVVGSCKKLEPFITPSFNCTACGREMLEVPRIYEHPVLLGVGICCTCYAILSTKKVRVDRWEEHCTWCGRGKKTSYKCGQCTRLFCKDCIVRNYNLALIPADDKWSCFCCDPPLLCVHMEELKEFRILRANHSARLEDVKVEIPCGDPTIEEMIRARIEEEEEKRQTRNGTKSCSQSSRVKSRVPISSKKRRRASTGDHDRARELKQLKGIAKQPILEEPISPPPRKYIRPHQMREKRRQAAARREAAIRATERLKGNFPSSSSEESPIKKNLSTKFTEMSSDSEDL